MALTGFSACVFGSRIPPSHLIIINSYFIIYLMSPILRSRRTSPRLLVSSAATLAKPIRYEAIDFRTRQHFRWRNPCPPHLRAKKTSKRGKRDILFINHHVI